jgi:hypothetical protein
MAELPHSVAGQIANQARQEHTGRERMAELPHSVAGQIANQGAALSEPQPAGPIPGEMEPK